MAGHKTTVMLKPNVWLRLRNRADREHVPVGRLINDLLEHALVATASDGEPTSLASGESDVDDLGTNAGKYLREMVR